MEHGHPVLSWYAPGGVQERVVRDLVFPTEVRSPVEEARRDPLPSMRADSRWLDDGPEAFSARR